MAMDAVDTVGRGRAVVSVPDDWARGAVQCGTVTADTVDFEFSGFRTCRMGPRGFDSVTIGPAPRRQGNTPAAALRPSGVDVYTSISIVEKGYTVIVKVVPSADARFVIRVRNEALAVEIAESMRILPADMTTLPDIYQGATGGRPGESAAPDPAEVRRRLQRAGLRIAVRYAGDAGPDRWSSLKTDVEPGAVIEVGSTVTVTYSVGTKTP